MAIYELGDDEFQAVPMTSFASAGLLERQHLQRLLRSCIELVVPSAVVLPEEFRGWEGSARRIEGLALGRVMRGWHASRSGR